MCGAVVVVAIDVASDVAVSVSIGGAVAVRVEVAVVVGVVVVLFAPLGRGSRRRSLVCLNGRLYEILPEAVRLSGKLVNMLISCAHRELLTGLRFARSGASRDSPY